MIERLGARLGVLRLRDFRNVFIAQSVSTFGDGITPVALTFAVLDLTGSGTDLGLVLAAQVLPLMALALVGGVWADRLPRNLVMVASDLIRAGVQLIGAFLLLTGSAQVWQLALLAAIHGSAEAFFRPAAGALVPQIVPVAHLRQANALMGMSDNFGWMVGPAMAGTLVALIGAGGAIAVDGVTFLVSAAFLATLRVPAVKQAGARAAGFLSEFRQGWWEVTSRRWLWVMLLRVALVLCVVIAPFQVLGPIGLREQGLSTGEAATAWGWIQAAFSAGMIGGALFAIRYRPRRPMVTVSLMGASALVSPLTLALGGGPTALIATHALRGVAIGVLVTVWNTALQMEVEDEALGRVVAWDWMASLSLWPAGLALAGPLAESIGVTDASWLSFGLGAIAAFWVFAVPDIWRMRSRTSRPTVAGAET